MWQRDGKVGGKSGKGVTHVAVSISPTPLCPAGRDQVRAPCLALYVGDQAPAMAGGLGYIELIYYRGGWDVKDMGMQP
jgi:hypothetical protein